MSDTETAAANVADTNDTTTTTTSTATANVDSTAAAAAPDVAVAAAAMPAPAAPPATAEKTEEEKLLAKYPTVGSGLRGNGPSGHSAFLQKRLQKGQKYFDSGDYQMAKQKGGGIKQVFANKVCTTGDTIPTPESVPARKTSIIQPCNKFPQS